MEDDLLGTRDRTLDINGRTIGPGRPMYIVAEISANHNQDLDKAKELVREAAQAGADAVKLQTYTPDTMTIRSDRPEFRVGAGTPWEGTLLHDLYQTAYTPWEWHEELFEEARGLGMDPFSTPFDPSAVRFLEPLDPVAHKIASFEITDLPLISSAAATGRPLIISTGMATQQEVEEAVQAARQGGCTDLAILRCNSSYPAPTSQMDLRTIPDMQRRFGVPVGLSDHTLGSTAAVAAVALGACILEKHFIMDRGEGGPDSSFSTQPEEFRTMVETVREAEAALGGVRYGPTEAEKNTRILRRSLFVVKDIAAGEPFTEENVRAIRPGHGLPPKHLQEILGQRAARAIERGTPLAWDVVARPPSVK